MAFKNVEITLHNNEEVYWEGAISGKNLLSALRQLVEVSTFREIQLVVNSNNATLTWRNWKVRFVNERGEDCTLSDRIYPVIRMIGIPPQSVTRQERDDFMHLFAYMPPVIVRKRKMITGESVRDFLRIAIVWHVRKDPASPWRLER